MIFSNYPPLFIRIEDFYYSLFAIPFKLYRDMSYYLLDPPAEYLLLFYLYISELVNMGGLLPPLLDPVDKILALLETCL